MGDYKKPMPEYKGKVQGRHQFCTRGAIYFSLDDEELKAMHKLTRLVMEDERRLALERGEIEPDSVITMDKVTGKIYRTMADEVSDD